MGKGIRACVHACGHVTSLLTCHWWQSVCVCVCVTRLSVAVGEDMCCLMAMMLMLLTTRVLARHISSNLTSTLHILYGHHSRTWCNSSVPDCCISTYLMLQPYTDMSVINYYYYDVFGTTSMTALHGVQCSVNHTCPGLTARYMLLSYVSMLVLHASIPLKC